MFEVLCIHVQTYEGQVLDNTVIKLFIVKSSNQAGMIPKIIYVIHLCIGIRLYANGCGKIAKCL